MRNQAYGATLYLVGISLSSSQKNFQVKNNFDGIFPCLHCNLCAGLLEAALPEGWTGQTTLIHNTGLAE